MSDEQRATARRFMQTYVDGDVEALLACLADAWVIHDVDGSTSSRSDMGEVTRLHAEGFPEKSVAYLHEVVEGGHVAHHVRFTLVHSGRYYDLEPTGREIELEEMIFHRMDDALIGESWRMIFPEGAYAALTDG
jgi:predicted ester cyclase